MSEPSFIPAGTKVKLVGVWTGNDQEPVGEILGYDTDENTYWVKVQLGGGIYFEYRYERDMLKPILDPKAYTDA